MSPHVGSYHGGPHARIARQPLIRDVWGDAWRVHERRPIPYGFAIMLGRPDGARGRLGGTGGRMVIVTPRFAAFVRAHVQRPYVHPLPISRNAYRRVRRRLGVDHRAWIDTRLAWWLDRLDDLATLSGREFVERHSTGAWTRTGALSIGLVRLVRKQLLGRQRRPVDWWKAPAVLALLRSGLPWQVVAKRLKLPRWTVYVFRQKARQLGTTVHASRQASARKDRRQTACV